LDKCHFFEKSKAKALDFLEKAKKKRLSNFDDIGIYSGVLLDEKSIGTTFGALNSCTAVIRMVYYDFEHIIHVFRLSRACLEL
jgi:hypothetical protein